MLNASVGVQRVLGRVRRTSIDSMHRDDHPDSTPVSTRASRSRYGYMATSAHVYPVPRRRRRAFVLPSLSVPSADVRVDGAEHPRRRRAAVPAHSPDSAFVGLGHERVVAIAAAGILLSASFLSVAPGGPSGDTGGPSGDGQAPRLAIAGSGDGDDVGIGRGGLRHPERRPDEGGADGTLAHPDLEPDRDRQLRDRRRRRREPSRYRGRPGGQGGRRRGAVPRRRHAAQAGRGRHDGAGRQRPHARPTASSRATRWPRSPAASTSR